MGFLEDSSIQVFRPNRFITVSDSVLVLHSSGIVHSTGPYVSSYSAPIQFVNTTANFTGPFWNASWSTVGLGHQLTSDDDHGISFVDSFVTFPNCSSLDEVISATTMSIKGGRVWCLKNNTLRGEPKAQLATLALV